MSAIKPDFSHRVYCNLLDTVISMTKRADGVLTLLGEVVSGDRVDQITNDEWAGIIGSLRSEILDIEAVVRAWHVNQTAAAKDKATTTP